MGGSFSDRAARPGTVRPIVPRAIPVGFPRLDGVGFHPVGLRLVDAGDLGDREGL